MENIDDENKLNAMNFEATLSVWFTMQDELKNLKHKELELRKKIFNFAFKNPVEGVNNYALDNTEGSKYTLKGTLPLRRSIDDAMLLALRDDFAKRCIPTDKLIKQSQSLIASQYWKLTDAERLFFDQCLTITVGAPTLKIAKSGKI